jgi:HD superfamily phosphohydrolase
MSWRVRDPIHGFIDLGQQETLLLDTFPMQRLRGIRQLAMASLVYPGALHTRFDHTLGVTHVAGQMCQSLGVDGDPRRIIRLAALLHDVGHGPFSHVSESVLESVSGENLAKKAKQKDKIHELITRQIILNSPYFKKPISGHDRESVARLLRDGWDKRIFKEIVSGPLDADKQDYLLRDSYFCGVPYGHYDIRQLHNSFKRITLDGDEALSIEPNGLHSLEQFVLAKYYLTTQVYRHKVRLITDQMLTRGLTLGVEVDKLPFLEGLYRYPVDGDEDALRAYVENFLAWNDARLVEEVLSASNEKTLVADVFRRLRERKLFKRVFQMSLSHFPPSLRIVLPDPGERRAKRSAIETRIAEFLTSECGVEIPAHLTIFHYYKIESVRTQSKNSERSILITRDGAPQLFEDESTLFKSIDDKLKDEMIEVYAPVCYGDETQKKALLRKCDERILAIIEKEMTEQQQSTPPAQPSSEEGSIHATS